MNALAVIEDVRTDQLVDNERVTVLLKPAEVAARLGVSRTWIYDAAKSGRIPAIRLGHEDGPLRFVAEDLECWLEEARAAWQPGRRSARAAHLRRV